MQRLLNGDGVVRGSRIRSLRHAGQIIGFILVFPGIEGVLGADGQLSPSDQAVRVPAVRDRRAGLADAALVHDFMVAPAVGQEGDDLGKCVRPGALHIVHTAIHELRCFLVLGGLAARLNVQLAVSHQHFNGKQHAADGRIVFSHLGIGLDAANSLQLCEELLHEDRAIAVGVIAILSNSSYFVLVRQMMSPAFL